MANKPKSTKRSLRYGVFACWLIFTVTSFIIVKPYNGTPQLYSGSKDVKHLCDFTDQRTDFCEASGDIRIHGKSSTIFVASSDQGEMLEYIKPYARKDERVLMRYRVKTITIRSTNISRGIPECSRTYTVPAIVFSNAGLTKNHFHDFTDLAIPLYSTSLEFNKEVQFLVTDNRSTWATKFKELLPELTRYEVIDLDYETQVLCYPRVLVGLKAYKEFSIDVTRSPYSMRDFTMFLRNIYSLKRATRNSFIRIDNEEGSARSPPRLLIIARKETRRLLNAEEVANIAKNIGFDVHVDETGGDLKSVAKFINSFDALMGVHGAGLSNMVFMPENAVVIQIIPWGMSDYVAHNTFKTPANDMNLRYIEYKISPNESSLIQDYPFVMDIVKDPHSHYAKVWNASKARHFLNTQNVKLDLDCFEGVLSKAYDLLLSM